MKIIYINNPDFYQRTKEDLSILNGLWMRRTKELCRCRDDYQNKHKLEVWAKAYNDIFRDYCHMLPWLSELSDRGITLCYRQEYLSSL